MKDSLPSDDASHSRAFRRRALTRCRSSLTRCCPSLTRCCSCLACSIDAPQKPLCQCRSRRQCIHTATPSCGMPPPQCGQRQTPLRCRSCFSRSSNCSRCCCSWANFPRLPSIMFRLRSSKSAISKSSGALGASLPFGGGERLTKVLDIGNPGGTNSSIASRLIFRLARRSCLPRKYPHRHHAVFTLNHQLRHVTSLASTNGVP